MRSPSFSLAVIGAGLASVLVSAAHAGGDDLFAISLDQTVSDGVPGTGAGNIEIPDAVDRYEILLFAGDRVFFDELSGGCSFDWVLLDPAGTDEVFSDATGVGCGGDVGLLTVASTGIHTIVVDPPNDTTGTYSFIVRSVPDDETFTITIGDVVEDGFPTVGAGNIESAGVADRYEIVLSAGDVLFLDELSGGCAFDWTLESPSGALLLSDATGVGCGSDPDVVEIAESGVHVITVDPPGDQTGTYSFTPLLVPDPQTFAITTKQFVGAGDPASGAGTIEVPGAIDVYEIDLVAGSPIFVDELSGGCQFDWRLESPSGDVIANDGAGIGCGGDVAVIEPTESGTHRLVVDPTGDGVGTYSFIVYDVNAVETFTIALEDVVEPGVPGIGAGEIEEPGAIDVYEIALSAGTEVFFDELSGGCQFDWRLEAPSGAIVFNDGAGIGCGGDPAIAVITETGVHRIIVDPSSDGIGTYSFTTELLVAPDVFALPLETIVTPGSLGAGSAEIEEVGGVDVYEFELAAGDRIFIDELAGGCDFDFTVLGPDDSELASDAAGIGCGGDIEIVDAVQSGTHRIVVDPSGDGVGTYSFIVYLVNEPQIFTLVLDEIAAPDAQGPGSGRIEEPGAVDVYEFAVDAPPLEVCFDEIAGGCNIEWGFLEPDGTVVFFDPGGIACGGASPGIFELLQEGTYRVRVDPIGDGVGEYSFRLRERRVADLNGDCAVNGADLAIVLGAWGACPAKGECVADLNADGNVDGADLAIVLGDWGD